MKFSPVSLTVFQTLGSPQLASLSPRKFCYSMLPKVSRSFVLGTLLLRGKLKDCVVIGYILCRMADTIEDDLQLSASMKTKFLTLFLSELEGSSLNSKTFVSLGSILSGESSHVVLFQHAGKVGSFFNSLPSEQKQIVYQCVQEMVLGMIKFIEKYPSGIRLNTMKEYSEYCYYVAGTVGKMLTALWEKNCPFLSDKQKILMKKYAEKFGEALQCVNILKDVVWDMRMENSIYIPQELLLQHNSEQSLLLDPNFRLKNTAAIKQLIELTRSDLNDALCYIIQIPLFHPFVRFFCIFPFLMAVATLRELVDAGERILDDKKIKLSRDETKKILLKSFLASFSNHYLKKIKYSLDQALIVKS